MIESLARSPSARDIVRQAPFFSELDSSRHEVVLALGTQQHWEAGEVVYRTGEPAQHFYVLVQGIVRLTIGLDTRIASAGDILHCGQVFGWAALTPDSSRRIATAACVTDATMLAIHGPGLLAQMDLDHTLGYLLMRQLNRLVTGTLTACAAG